MKILRYLKTCPAKGLWYNTKHEMGNTLEIQGYVDADWAGSPYDRRSTSDYCIKLGGNLVVWKGKK